MNKLIAILGDDFGKESVKTIRILALTVIGLVATFFLIKNWRKWFGKPDDVELPDGGQGVPKGWSPEGSIIQLRTAMFGSGNGNWYDPSGWGTSTQIIEDVISDKTQDQLALIYNRYNEKYRPSNLLNDFESDLSDNPDTLSFVLNRFSFLQVNPRADMISMQPYQQRPLNYRK